MNIEHILHFEVYIISSIMEPQVTFTAVSIQRPFFCVCRETHIQRALKPFITVSSTSWHREGGEKRKTLLFRAGVDTAEVKENG